MIGEAISNNNDILETYIMIYQSFSNIVPNLKIIPNENFETTIEHKIENPMQNATNSKVILVQK